MPALALVLAPCPCRDSGWPSARVLDIIGIAVRTFEAELPVSGLQPCLRGVVRRRRSHHFLRLCTARFVRQHGWALFVRKTARPLHSFVPSDSGLHSVWLTSSSKLAQYGSVPACGWEHA